MDEGDGAGAADPASVEHPDDLYGLDPAAFTAARNALAKRLRAGGRREEAAEVAALRRPPATAWALDQVARAHPDLVTEALATGAALREATDAAMGGDTSRLKDASAAERAASGALVDAAAALLGTAGEQAKPRLAATVRAAVLDEAVADELRRGVLSADHDRSGLGLGGGFDLAAAPARHLRVVPDPGSTRSRRPKVDRSGPPRPTEPTGATEAAPAPAPAAPTRGATVAERREAARARAGSRTSRSAGTDAAGAEGDAEARAAARREAAEAAEAARRAAAEAARRSEEEEAERAEAARLLRRRINELRTEATKATRRAARLVRVAEEAEAEAADARGDADAASAAADAVVRDLAEAQAEADRLRSGGGERDK